jgi:uncharacterized protein YbjT (DUF2867 family)
MKIVIIGGTGLIGRGLVHTLRLQGHEAVPASPSTGINTLTGEGLAEALDGAEVVIDVTNSPSFEPDAVLHFFTTSSRNLAQQEKVSGVRHHIALSIVGIERNLASGYMRAKVAQEAIIKESGIPYTILRATQFFEFLPTVAEAGLKDGAIHLPAAAMQPIAAQDVIDELARLAVSIPKDETLDLAGPEKLPMSELVQRVFDALRDTRKVIADPDATYFGAPLDDSSITPTGLHPILGPTRLGDWLKTNA